MTAESLAHSLNAKKQGSRYMALCPGHADKNPSLSIEEKGGKVLLKCFAGCKNEKLIGIFRSQGVWESNGNGKPKTIRTEYGYTDKNGELLYQVVRVEPGLEKDKDFYQRRPDGFGGWVNKKGERQVLYRLPDVLASSIVFVAEGEKDADTLKEHGFTGTTNAGGATAPWLESYTRDLVGKKDVPLIPDNDKPGRIRVIKIARTLFAAGVNVSLIEVQGVKDVTDWFRAGHGDAEFSKLFEDRQRITSAGDIDAVAQRWDLAASEESNQAETAEIAAAAETARPRITEVSQIASVRTYAAQKIEFLVEGMIAVGTVFAITGESGSGKTTLATAICSAVERGADFAGLKTLQRRVLVLDRENPPSVVIERLDRLGISDDSENFTIWGGWAPEEAPSPFSPIVSRFVESCDPKPLILVDSLIAFNEGDENDATQTREFFKGIRKLADMGATVGVLHHCGKDGADYRGSSDIKASVDTAFKLTNCGDPARLGTLKLKAFKARFLVNPEMIFHYFDGQFTLDNRPVSRTNDEILQGLMIRNPGLTGKAFIEEAALLKISQSRARDFLDSGRSAGSIRVEKGEHNTRFHYWNGSETE